MIHRIAAPLLGPQCGGLDLHGDELTILKSHKVNAILLGHRHLPALLFEDDRRRYVFTDQASAC